MKKLFLTIGFAAGTLMLAAQPQVVAHRGFHAAEGSWENTVSSLRNAQRLGIYGVEFDVNMTADDSLIVYHGPKILDTKLHAQKNRFAEIRAVKLPGGLEIPTLREFFAQGQKDPSTKLILEIKKHATPQRETQVVEAILRLAREMRLVPQIEFISFSRHACDEVLRLQPDAVVVYVSSDMAAMSPAEAKKRGYGGLSYQLNVLMNRPELVDEANRLGIAALDGQRLRTDRLGGAPRHHLRFDRLSRQGRSLSGSRRSLQEQEIIRLPHFRATHRQFASGGRNGTSCNLRTEQMISPPASSIDRESDCGVKSQTSHKTQCRKDSKRIILKTKTNVFVTPRAEPDSFGRSRGGKTTE